MSGTVFEIDIPVRAPNVEPTALSVAKLTNNLKNVSAAAKGTSFKANEAAEALGKIGGPLGVVGQKALGVKAGFDKVCASLGALGP